MITFRPAARENVPLLIGLAGGTGSGKTYSAMKLAAGIAGSKRFAVIDTENGRARHYADTFQFDVADLTYPFRPDRYMEAIKAADAAGYPVVVVDSMSHEYTGDGGLLDWHEEEYQRMGGHDGVKMTAWIKPKQAHKKMVSALLNVTSHVILCFRAETKIEIVPDPDRPGKKKIVPMQTKTGLDGWVPVCEKNLPYELTMSFLLHADHPGVPRPIKLQEQHRPMVALDRPMDEQAGAALAAWASGGTTAKTITKAQQQQLGKLIQEQGIGKDDAQQIVYQTAGVTRSADIPADTFDAVLTALAGVQQTIGSAA